MSEGTVPGLEAADLEESVATPDVIVLEALLGPAGEASLDVRPKDRSGLQKPVDDQEWLETEHGGTGEWWLGPLGTVDYRAPPPQAFLLNLSGAHFAQWRELRIPDDDWSYSTAVGSQTIEVLQEMFEAAGFREQAWQWLAGRGGSSVPGTPTSRGSHQPFQGSWHRPAI